MYVDHKEIVYASEKEDDDDLEPEPAGEEDGHDEKDEEDEEDGHDEEDEENEGEAHDIAEEDEAHQFAHQDFDMDAGRVHIDFDEEELRREYGNIGAPSIPGDRGSNIGE
ncbi:hypothetical protein CAEBREN_08842 [Caenorhabditis brenneri]|uniref:Uncharacterized protein n=1 Tax=Caenorhabditis brenneri TaxID=135651 RepID=G0NZL5_CAEBE|nr:hypothetical protein CAEBREN_08842 [Caenorhabditis brenneri]